MHIGLNFDKNFMTANLSVGFATLPGVITGVTSEKMNAISLLVLKL